MPIYSNKRPDYKRIFVKITRETIPQIKDKYPFVYLERGRLEVDDSSVQWIDCSGNVVPLPIATIGTMLLGPGTSVTHDAIKTMAAANCCICWVAEDSLSFYATGLSPTADTRNLLKQIKVCSDKRRSLAAARRMFAQRFPTDDLSGKTLHEMMGMEGIRVRQIYERKAEQYGVGWKGRKYIPGQMELSDITNHILTLCNAALYGVVTSSITAMGYTPYIGFIHNGSPLPFTYDIADLYKEDLCIDLAFSLTKSLQGIYDKYQVSDAFRQRLIDLNILSRIGDDINNVIGEG